MTRRIIAFEGKPTVDKRFLLPYSITVKDDSIPVTMSPDGSDNPFGMDKVVGKATDFERDDETGAISFDIHTKKELPEKLNGHMFCTSMEYHIENDVMIVESARIRLIYFSEAPQGWGNLDVSKSIQTYREEQNKLRLDQSNLPHSFVKDEGENDDENTKI